MNPITSLRYRKVRARFQTPGDVWLGARMMAWACSLPLLKHALPLPALVRLVRANRRTRTLDAGHAERQRLRCDQIVDFARWSSRLTRWSRGGNCLERGLVAYRFL